MGMGIKPTEKVEADIQGMRFKFATQSRAANFVQGTINPPLADLKYIGISKKIGFDAPIVQSLSHGRPRLGLGRQNKTTYRLMNALEAQGNSRILREAIRLGAGNLSFYISQKSTLREVIAGCVSEGNLDSRWLPKGEFADIGYS